MGIKFDGESEESNPPTWVYIHMVPVAKPIRVTIGGKNFDCR